MSTTLTAFPPLARRDARVLILGSMPGVASLQARQYYAHPRNAFWPIMAALFGFDPQQPYTQRTEHLLAQQVAVWDVLHHCQREGSLDSAILRQSEVAHDFDGFLAAHPAIHTLFFNGQAARHAFDRHVWPTLSGRQSLARFTLPSTSPALAGLSFAQKRDIWQIVAQAAQASSPPAPV